MWYGEPRLWDDQFDDVVSNEDEGKEVKDPKRKRWGVEIVMVGEMVFDVVPSFERIGSLAVNVSRVDSSSFSFPFFPLRTADLFSSAPPSTASTSDFLSRVSSRI